MKTTINFASARVILLAGAAALTLATLGGCGPDAGSPVPPSVEWNQQKYGRAPERRPLSGVEIATDQTWVVAREKPLVDTPPNAAAPPSAVSVVHYQIGGMDCGDCQHLVANELGKLSGVRLARVSQSPPETVVEYDPAKLDAKQIEGTVAGLGLWPKPLPPESAAR